MLRSLVDIQYCYDVLVNQISIGLLLYSHIPAAVFALLFGGFVYFKSRKTGTGALFLLCICFAAWCFLDLSAWFAFLGSRYTMFTWAILDVFSVLFSFYSYYFLYTFIKGKDLPAWQKIVGFATLIPILYLLVKSLNLNTFNTSYCEALESDIAITVAQYTRLFYMVLLIAFTIKEYFATKIRSERNKIALAGTGVVVFVCVFFIGVILEILAGSFGVEYSYNLEIYGLFGMPVMLVYIGYLIVKYHAFDVRVFVADGLIVFLVALVASLYTFLHDIPGIIVNSISLVLVLWLGIYLARNVRREVALREELQVANEGQSNLIHFITHQVKGYFTKSRSVFNELLTEPDYGPLPELAKGMAQQGFDSLTEGVQMVQQVLSASSIEKGTMQYTTVPVEFGAVVRENAESLRTQAEAKGLEFKLDIPAGDFKINGDPVQLKEVVRNLIDNAIRYTMKGSVTVSLKKVRVPQVNGKLDAVQFSVKDSGVGISPEDKAKLFTKGGRGKDSLKVNVNSTGYGLYIVKQIVEQGHHGRVWVESAGPGTGSTFIVEIPGL